MLAGAGRIVLSCFFVPQNNPANSYSAAHNECVYSKHTQMSQNSFVIDCTVEGRTIHPDMLWLLLWLLSDQKEIIRLNASEPETHNKLMMDDAMFSVVFCLSAVKGSITPYLKKKKKTHWGKIAISHGLEKVQKFFVFCSTVQLERSTSPEGVLEPECDDRFLWLRGKWSNWRTSAALQSDYGGLLRGWVIFIINNNRQEKKNKKKKKNNPTFIII